MKTLIKVFLASAMVGNSLWAFFTFININVHGSIRYYEPIVPVAITELVLSGLAFIGSFWVAKKILRG